MTETTPKKAHYINLWGEDTEVGKIQRMIVEVLGRDVAQIAFNYLDFIHDCVGCEVAIDCRCLGSKGTFDCPSSMYRLRYWDCDIVAEIKMTGERFYVCKPCANEKIFRTPKMMDLFFNRNATIGLPYPKPLLDYRNLDIQYKNPSSLVY